MASLGQVEAEMLKIPACSPDINPIENIFHLVKSQLNKQAVTENISDFISPVNLTNSFKLEFFKY
jgi:transposase